MSTNCFRSEFAMPSQRSDRLVSNNATNQGIVWGPLSTAIEIAVALVIGVSVGSSATHCSMLKGTQAHVRCGAAVYPTQRCVRRRFPVKQAAVPALRSFGHVSHDRHARRPAVSAAAAVKGVASSCRTKAGIALVFLTVCLVQMPQLQARLKRKQTKNDGKSPGAVSVLWINGDGLPRSCCCRCW